MTSALIAVIAGAGIVGLVWFVLRGRGGSTSRDGRLTTRIASDGFFICGELSSRTEVRYEALVSGSWRRGIATVSGSETFVYTGTPPREVRIVGLDEVERVSVSPPSSGPSSTSSTDSVFSGFPSAY